MGDVAAYLRSLRALSRVFMGVASAALLTLLLLGAPAADSKARDTTPPSRPTGLAVLSMAQNRPALTWNASTDNVGVARYVLYRNGTKIRTVTTTFSSETGRLACGRSYMFGVVARDAAGNSSKKAQLRVSMSACVPRVPPYFVADYANGAFGAPWTIMFSHTSPGYSDLRKSGTRPGTPDGRVSVAAPPGSPEAAARFELRDADPGWPIRPTLDKAEVRTDTQQTFNQAAVNVGDVRWFSTRIYLPYTSTEKFELAHGGSNPYTDILELHTTGNDWAALSLSMYPTRADRHQWAYFRIFGGTMGSTANYERVNLWRLTDGSGSRVMSNHNRWIHLVWGMRFAPDNTGWLEVWVDGVNVYPRKSRPTMWAGDYGQYFKYGLYKQKDASFPESGRSVIYFGRTTIG